MRGAVSVSVNPIACVAHGLCAELLPERVALDEWGYPVVDGTPLSGRAVGDAKRAAAACPVLALRLDSHQDHGSRTAPAQRARRG